MLPPEAIAPGAAKVLPTVGAVLTSTLAVFDARPARATGLEAVTAPVVLFLVPAVVPVTFTCTWQLAPAAREVVPPESVIVASPAVWPGLTVPPHVLLKPGVVATCRPAGSTSLKATPFIAPGLPAGLVTVMVSVVVPPNAIVAAP